MKNFFRKIRSILLRPVETNQELMMLSLGRMEARQVKAAKISGIQEAEFQVFSQHGEDGIIQYLISKVPVKNKYFIEFGVGTYREANTRFLLQNDRWAGLIMDAGSGHKDYVEKESYLAQNHDIKAVKTFITPQNINELFKENNVPEEPGLLSIDIDYNDYFVIKAINKIKPAIIIAEFNALFGADRAIAVPYAETYGAYDGSAYFGASLKAITQAVTEKGYIAAGCDKSGVNAFFVRKDLAGEIKAMSAEEMFATINISKEKMNKELKKVSGKVVEDVVTREKKTIGEVFGV